MIKIILISTILFGGVLISNEIQWDGNPSIIGANLDDNNKSKEVESNSSLDVNLSRFRW